jgi:plastocyanin
MKVTRRCLLVLLIVSEIIAIKSSYTQTPAIAKASVPASQPAAVAVRIENFSFLPKELEIAVGTTVTWQNADDVPHTATSKGDPQVFDSGPLDTDDKFSFTFSKPGKYAYYCKVHPHMTGVIIVK